MQKLLISAILFSILVYFRVSRDQQRGRNIFIITLPKGFVINTTNIKTYLCETSNKPESNPLKITNVQEYHSGFDSQVKTCNRSLFLNIL